MASEESGLRSLRGQLSALGTAFAQIQEKLSDALALSDERMSQLHMRVGDLEAEKAAMSSEMLRLQAENDELRRLLEIHQPDVTRAIDARDAALRKLHRARRFIRDLIDERKTGSHPDTAQHAERPGTSVQDPTSDESWDELESVGTASSSEDEDTVRPNTTTRCATEINEISPLRGVLEVPEQWSGGRQEHLEQHALPTASDRVAQGPTPPPSQTGQPRLPGSQEDWYIEYSRPPATATVATSPLSYFALQERLGLDEEEMICLESVERIQDPCMRIHIHGDIAFIYKPIVLEGPDSTYVINWGDRTVNKNIKAYLTHGTDRPANSVFHVFVNPGIQAAWWYLGAHTLTARDMPAIWHTVLRQRGEDRKLLCSQLKQQWNSELEVKEIGRQIREGELEQCCIELINDGHHALSVKFIQDILKTEVYHHADEEDDDD